MPITNITNYHQQLHHCFKALTPDVFMYTTESHLEMISVPNNKKTTIFKTRGIQTFDVHRNLAALGFHSIQKVSLVNINTPLKEVEHFDTSMEGQLVNHIKFYHDAQAQLKLMIAGNDRDLQMFDVQKG